MIEEIREIRAEPLTLDGRRDADADFSCLLISRRLGHVLNSPGLATPAIEKLGTTNFAYMSPDDVKELGLESGSVVEITGRHGRIQAVVEATPELRRGVISMSHAWGALPGQDAHVREVGSNTSRLVSTDREYDSITGMARQSTIPVNVRAA